MQGIDRKRRIPLHGQIVRPFRRRERGVTILLVAVAMMALLAMAALAIDIVTLYVSEGEAQRVADAAALAGAKVFVSSGFTSWQLGDPALSTTQNLVCNGSTGLADLQAQAVANHNVIAGTAPTSVTTSCNFSPEPKNPQISVTVQRTGLPSFFARIWGSQASSVTTKAKAEAYNPSGQTVPIGVSYVKPWLIPNCGPCAGGPDFFTTTTYDIANNGAFIGQASPPTSFTPTTPGSSPNPPAPNPAPGQYHYYPINIPISPPAPVCPSPGAVSCGGGGAPGADYHDNIACSGTFQFSCGQQIGPSQSITVDTDPPGQVKTSPGTQCLIHAQSNGLGSGQDIFNPGAPVTITGGDNNPNTALRNVASISRSDSVITVPVYDVIGGATEDLCPSGICSVTGTVVGFLQLGIESVDSAGDLNAVILNAAGCNPTNSGTPVSGGGVSPIPVRLIQ